MGPAASGATGPGPEGGPGPAGPVGKVVVALLVLGSVAAGAWSLLAPDDGSEPRAGGSSVAVLPFEPIGTENPGPIVEGLHNDLLTRLSSLSGLSVISATSVERFRRTDLPLPVIADSLGVRRILEGDVQRSGGEIAIHAQLIDPRTDTHAWAASYRRELTAGNLFDLQTDITRRIARSLEAELTAAEERRVDRVPTTDLEAYRLYARGRGLLLQRTDSSVRRAETLFRRALERDSTFAPAWALLAHSLVFSPKARGRDPDSVFPPGRQAARRVRELESDYMVGQPEGHALYRLGELTERDTVVHEVIRRRLLALSEARSGDSTRVRRLLSELTGRAPPPTLWLGLLQAAAGRRTEALETFRAAFRRQEMSGGGLTINLRYHYPDVLGPLRRDPRWDALMREVNLGWGLNPDGSLPDSVDLSAASPASDR